MLSSDPPLFPEPGNALPPGSTVKQDELSTYTMARQDAAMTSLPARHEARTSQHLVHGGELLSGELQGELQRGTSKREAAV